MASIPSLIQLLLVIITIPTIVSTQKCTNPLPALMQMASGVDITSLDLFPIGDSSEKRGLLENVFNFTCSGGKIGQKLKNKDDGGNFSDYDLPDQIFGVSMKPKSVVRKFMSDWATFKSTLLARVHPGYYDDTLGAFARSSKYTSLLKQHFGSNKVFYDIDNRSAELVPYINVIDAQYNGSNARVNQSILSHDFFDFITQKLPLKYEDNVTAYETSIARFGTHYFSEVQISDYDYVQFVLDQGYMLDSSDWKINDDMSAAFKDYFDNSSKDGSNTSEVILAYSALKNGSSKWLDKVTNVQYQSKLFTGPSIRRAQLRYIDYLIDNETIGEQVSIAVQMHRLKAHLEQLNNIYAFTSDYYQMTSEEKVAFENVTKFVNSGDIKQIDQMVTIASRLYDKVRRVRDRHFLGPVIDDLYVIASAKLAFAKQICTFSFKRFVKGHWSQCPDYVVRNGERETSDLYDSYHNAPWYDLYNVDSVSGYMNALEQTRRLNRRYGFRADITNGLTAICGDCGD